MDVEIKNGPFFYPGIERAVAEACDRHAWSEMTLATSFDHHCVRRLHQVDARIATAILYYGRPVDPVADARAAHAGGLLPHWSFVDASLIQTAHAAGVAVAAWESTDPRALTHLVRLGIDRIGTNAPDVLKRIVDGEGASSQNASS